MNSCVVLFSGGLDSTTALYWARRRFGTVHPLTFDYGQRHRVEIQMAVRTAARLGLPLVVLEVDLTQIGGSALTDAAIPVPRLDGLPPQDGWSPATYVPFRNGIFLSLASAWAEVRGTATIVCGFNVIDSPDYPDTRPEFVRAMEEAVRLGTRAESGGRTIRFLAPFIDMKKSEVIRAGLELGADYSTSASCYSGEEVPCGHCPACLLRQKAWQEVGLSDPLLVRLEKEGKMSWILRVRDKFQAAHYLKEYKGKCEKVHGHSFQVEVRIDVTDLDKTGIGIDFTLIKKKLTEILPDHALLNEVYDFNPTAENLSRRFFQDLKAHFPVKAVTVWESEDASATYTEDR